MPDETAPTRRKRSTLNTVALALAVVIGAAFVIGLGPAVLWIFVFDKADHTRWTTAQSEMAEITKALNDYALDHAGAYPSDLAPLTTTHFPSGVPKDPFSKADYIYKRTADGFTLTCLGKDVAPGGSEIPEKDIEFFEGGMIKS